AVAEIEADHGNAAFALERDGRCGHGKSFQMQAKLSLQGVGRDRELDVGQLHPENWTEHTPLDERPHSSTARLFASSIEARSMTLSFAFSLLVATAAQRCSEGAMPTFTLQDPPFLPHVLSAVSVARSSESAVAIVTAPSLF